MRHLEGLGMRFEKVKLGELCDISSSRRIFAKEYVDEGIPFYRSKEIILKQLEKENGNKLACAKTLQITRATLYNRINKLGLDV